MAFEMEVLIEVLMFLNSRPSVLLHCWLSCDLSIAMVLLALAVSSRLTLEN